MSPKRPTDAGRPPHWLLRRADQAAVGGLVLVALTAMFSWWASQGGWRGRLIELERAEPQTAQFQVDINTAEWTELQELPGIGETLARRIVDSRQEDGPFLDHDDLRRVRGIGRAKLEQIRPYLRPMPPGGNLAGR